MFNAKVLPEFLAKEDYEYLLNIIKDINVWENAGSEFWNNRVINYSTMLKHNRDAAIIMLDSNIRCAQYIKNEYNLDTNVYSDTLQVIRWFPGMEQPPHADDMTNTETKGFEHRVFGSIIYLNDNYVGGHTYYPNHNFEVIPKAGQLAIHPGDPEHLHGVTKIENEMRYTIASFWTYDKNRANDWPLY